MRHTVYTKKGVLIHPSAGEVPLVRLLECAKRKGDDTLWNLAWRAVNYIGKTENVERANITKDELFGMFQLEVEREQPYGGPLWSLSTKPSKNMSLFRKMDVGGMKEKWPRARHAIRILEVAHRKRWLLDLASYAADVEKERRTRAAEFAEEPTIQKKYWEW